MKILILKPTAIAGDHVASGDVVDKDEATLKQLKLYGKAVALADANEDQKKLIAAREAAKKGAK